MTIRNRVWISLVCILFLAGCDVTDRTTKPEVACFNNLRQIDTAEQMWAMEKHKSTNDTAIWPDLQDYLKSTNIMCPVGGIYSLARIGEPPTCSIREHNTLYRKNRPQTSSLQK
jgi:hypothetical protein